MNSDHPQLPMRGIVVTGLLAAAVLGLWLFPLVWYRASDPGQSYFWLSESTNVAGWTYKDHPVAESAEKVLVADRLVNGEFNNSKREPVRVFSAKRYIENQNEIGLFVHTPDRCWTQAGWKMQPIAPDYVDLDVHGVKIRFERRLFTGGKVNELVYFSGLTGGQPLPYRLDHNLSVAMKYQLKEARGDAGAALRAADDRFWKRVWESFVSRRQLLGPKQFIRISTSVNGDLLEEADQRLREFIPQWLARSDYTAELAAISAAKTEAKR